MIDELNIPDYFIYCYGFNRYEEYMAEDPNGINELLDKIYGIAFNRHILSVKKPDFYFEASYNLATRLAHVQHVENVRIYGRIQQKATAIYRLYKSFNSDEEVCIPENDYRVVLWMVFALMYFNESKTPGQSAFLEMLASRIDPEYSPGQEVYPSLFDQEFSLASEDDDEDDAFVKISRLVKENKLELIKYKCSLPRIVCQVECFCRHNDAWDCYDVQGHDFKWMKGLETDDFKILIASYKTFDEQYIFYQGLVKILSHDDPYKINDEVDYSKIIGTDQDPIKKVLDQGKMLSPENPELPSLPLYQPVNEEEGDEDTAAFRERCNDVVELYRAKCKALEKKLYTNEKEMDYLCTEKGLDEDITDFNDKLEKKYKNLLKQYEELKEKNRLDNEKLTMMSDKVLMENEKLKKKVEELQGIVSAQQDFDGICLDKEDVGCNQSQAPEGDGESVQKVIRAITTFAITSDKVKDTQVGVLSEVLEEITLGTEVGKDIDPSVQLELVKVIRDIERNRMKIKTKKEKPASANKMADQINISLGEQTNQHQDGARQLAEDIVDNLLSGNAYRKEVSDD